MNEKTQKIVMALAQALVSEEFKDCSDLDLLAGISVFMADSCMVAGLDPLQIMEGTAAAVAWVTQLPPMNAHDFRAKLSRVQPVTVRRGTN